MEWEVQLILRVPDTITNQLDDLLLTLAPPGQAAAVHLRC